ncbi:MAG TPA: hypothetical protein VIA62_29845 [Thermoanaerobaculia bacterium]|jgi:hypothetical protein|nr:hypothetical protein [Thermoanaerobaculia bacterium]
MSNLSAAMTSLLMVPVKLDALVLKQDQMVVSARADFSALPYTNGTRDVNADTANLSENILSEPFENQTLNLKAGIHLHWSLPDALTRGAHSADGTDFPAVPNRWLVIRSGVPPAETWVVESDYLVPDGAPNPQGSISTPYTPDPAHARWQPFRYQGRKMFLSDWPPHDANPEYLPKLTAAGYGETTFAALYANCRSVFGFHDENPVAAGLRYDVIGWYSDPAADPLAALVAGLARQDVHDAIQEKFNWDVELSAGQEVPRGMLCYARLTFQPGASTANPALADASTRITIAHTGTEALSAYLA